MTAAGTLTTRPLARDAVAWEALAERVATATDRGEVAAIVGSLAGEVLPDDLGFDVDLAAPQVVLQRTFARLHAVALRARA